LIALFCLLKRRVKQGKFPPDQDYFHSTISFRKACRTRLFTYHELDEATKGFEDGQKLVDGSNGTIYAGVLGENNVTMKETCFKFYPKLRFYQLFNTGMWRASLDVV